MDSAMPKKAPNMWITIEPPMLRQTGQGQNGSQMSRAAKQRRSATHADRWQRTQRQTKHRSQQAPQARAASNLQNRTVHRPKSEYKRALADLHLQADLLVERVEHDFDHRCDHHLQRGDLCVHAHNESTA
jgi:hypothetical protein